MILLLLVFFDLLAANHWMLATTDGRERREKIAILDKITSKNIGKTVAPPRIYRFPVWYPPEFKAKSSDNRLAEAIRWDRQSLFHRYTLPLRVDVVDVRGTVMPKDFYPVSRRLRNEIRSGAPDIFEQDLSGLGVQYIIAPGSYRDGTERNDAIPARPDWPEDVSLRKTKNPVERNYRQFEPGRLVFETFSEESETITVPEQYWPGWRTRLEDGTEIPVRKAENNLFRTIDLPPGHHVVTMWYDPPLFKLGFALSLFFTIFFAASYQRAGCAAVLGAASGPPVKNQPT